MISISHCLKKILQVTSTHWEKFWKAALSLEIVLLALTLPGFRIILKVQAILKGNLMLNPLPFIALFLYYRAWSFQDIF